MQDKIIRALKELEVKEQCRILFAAESGSRAWGFASPDSDYDIRAIYVKPEAWYWDITEKKRDTIEAQLPEDLDVSAWELRKALRLFNKCNPPLNEWLGSPIVYYADKEFYEKLKGFIPRFFDPVHAGHHYLAMAENAWKTVDSEGTITLKKLFYAQRGLLCAMWCAKFRSMPPTEFEKLLPAELISDEMLRSIRELRAQKQQAGEKNAIPVPKTLYDFYMVQREKVRQRLATFAFPLPDNAVLGELLCRCMTKYR